MPYFGVKVETDRIDVTVKLHGPLDTFETNTLELKGLIRRSAAEHFEVSDNIPELCFKLAEIIKDQYLNGNTLIWVDVQVEIKSNGVLFGATAEEILVP